jgi:hypothetical protein
MGTKGKNTIYNINTPIWLCEDIINKLEDHYDFESVKNILVWFSIEFVCVLLKKYKVNPKKITFVSDYDGIIHVAKNKLKVNTELITVESIGDKTCNKWRRIMDRKFDIIIGNPPYQNSNQKNKKGGGHGSRNTLWDKFLKTSLNIINEDGYICFVNPPRWRKPLSNLYKKMSSLQFNYIEFHSSDDGRKVFGASTPYDWYVLQNSPVREKTQIKDIEGNIVYLNLKRHTFLSSSNLDLVDRLIAKEGEKKCEVLFSSSEYETRKPWMSEEPNKKFKYPCVHATPKKGNTIFFYSSRKKDFFGIPKIIFGDGGTIQNCIIDVDGRYGITQHSIGLVIQSLEEGKKIKKAIESDRFNGLLQKSLLWSQFQIDWRLFTLFRRDFWKEFVE